MPRLYAMVSRIRDIRPIRDIRDYGTLHTWSFAQAVSLVHIPSTVYGNNVNSALFFIHTVDDADITHPVSP